LQKLNAAVTKLTKEIAKKYGREKLLIYTLWQSVVDKEVFEKAKIKCILYTKENFLLIRLACTNSSFATKLHYKIPKIIEKINLATKIRVKIELVN